MTCLADQAGCARLSAVLAPDLSGHCWVRVSHELHLARRTAPRADAIALERLGYAGGLTSRRRAVWMSDLNGATLGERYAFRLARPVCLAPPAGVTGGVSEGG
jgi:hypothetical protein